MTNHPFLPLRHRAVRLLWGAAVVSDVGTWVQLIVVGSLVAAHTGSAIQTGLVALATFTPQALASPVGGLLADRFDRRKVFASALMAQALVTAVLAVTLGLGVRTPAPLIVLILLCGRAPTIIQRDSPAASRGRVMSIMQSAQGVSYGVGLLVIGSIGDATNLHLAFGVGAVLLLAGFGALTLRSRHWRAAVDGREGGLRSTVALA